MKSLKTIDIASGVRECANIYAETMNYKLIQEDSLL